MLNTMRIIAKKSNANLTGEDQEVIKAIFLELDIDLSIDDLKIISTIKLEKIGL